MKILKNRQGITLLELMLSIAIASIIMLAVSAVLVNSQKSWNNMYNDIFSDVSIESLTIAKKFDVMVRQSSWSGVTIDTGGNWVEILYYNSPSSTIADRYAKFYHQNAEIMLDYGTVNPRQSLSNKTLCHNVTNCNFSLSGGAVQMFLTLASNGQSITVMSSNLMNNK